MVSFMRTDHDHRGFSLIELMMAIAMSGPMECEHV